MLTKEQNEFLKNSYRKGAIDVTDEIYDLVSSLAHTGYIVITPDYISNSCRYISYSLLKKGEAYVQELLDREDRDKRECESLVVAKKALRISSSARMWSIVAAVAAICGVIAAIIIAICSK